MGILDAQFRQHEQRWQLRLLPRGHEPHEWHDWSAPLDDPQQLFASLFDTERGWALLREPWHLRLQPERLGNRSQGIPHELWSHLIHPEYQRPILDLDWTVTELIARPLHAEVSGQICVVGNRSLAESDGATNCRQCRELRAGV